MRWEDNYKPISQQDLGTLPTMQHDWWGECKRLHGETVHGGPACGSRLKHWYAMVAAAYKKTHPHEKGDAR